MNDAGTSSKSDTPLTQPRSLDVPGAVTYFILAGDFIKIGSASNLKQRLHTLQTSHHQELEVLAAISAVHVDEFAVHQKFAHLRAKGEWFRAEKELLQFIDQAKVKFRDDATYEEPMAVKDLAAMRTRHGAESDIGHVCSNIIQQLKNLKTYVRPAWATDDRQTLPYEIGQQIKHLARLTRGMEVRQSFDF